MQQFFEGLTSSPVNMVMAVGVVLAVAYLVLPKGTVAKLAAKVKDLAAIPTPGSEAVEQEGATQSVTVPTRAGRLVDCLGRIDALEADLAACGVTMSEPLGRVREAASVAAVAALRSKGGGQ